MPVINRKKSNRWMNHVAAVRKKNPSKSLKEVLQIASKSYRKGHQAGGTIADPLNFAKSSAYIQRGGSMLDRLKPPIGIAPKFSVQPYHAKGMGILSDRVKSVRGNLGALAKLSPEQLRQNRGSLSF